MKSKKLLLLFVPAFLCACTEQKARPSSDSDVDAARNFIRASLDNDFTEARAYLLPDSANLDLLRMTESQRATAGKSENQKYKESTIHIFDTRKVDDSTSIVTYDNSYRKQKSDLRVVRRDGQWLVDLKYTLLRSDSTTAR